MGDSLGQTYEYDEKIEKSEDLNIRIEKFLKTVLNQELKRIFTHDDFPV